MNSNAPTPPTETALTNTTKQETKTMKYILIIVLTVAATLHLERKTKSQELTDFFKAVTAEQLRAALELRD